MLILYPVEGLANRMRAIDSAIRWSKETNIRCSIRWWRDPRLLDARWGDLFLPLPELKEASDKANERFLFFFKLKRHSRLFRGLLKLLEKLHILRVFSPDDWAELREMASKKEHYIWAIAQSYSVFYWPDHEKFQACFFRPIHPLQERIEAETTHFNEYTIGVHIRRTDHTLAIANSSDKAFLEAIQNHIEEDSRATFYICSDNQDIKQRIFDSFGDKKIILPEGELSRSSMGGIKQAVVELFSLASTRQIIGSEASSFSSMAGFLGNIPVVRAKN